jgi:hypothetical protein
LTRFQPAQKDGRETLVRLEDKVDEISDTVTDFKVKPRKRIRRIK